MSDDQEIITRTGTGPITVGQPRLAQMEISPMALIANALERGMPMDVIERLMKMKEELDAKEARKAYIAAMANFKKNDIVIEKNKQVGFESRRTGGKTSYKHATLDTVTSAVNKLLGENGLSYEWVPEQEGNMVKVTCIVTHIGGHSERFSLKAPPDDSGQKNGIQMVGSTISYLQRYLLLGALGLATSDMDNDGRGEELDEADSVAEKPIDEAQVANIFRLLEESQSDMAGFCAWLDVPAVEDIKGKDYYRASSALEDEVKKLRAAKK